LYVATNLVGQVHPLFAAEKAPAALNIEVVSPAPSIRVVSYVHNMSWSVERSGEGRFDDTAPTKYCLCLGAAMRPAVVTQ
jgi:hypothetical protein